MTPNSEKGKDNLFCIVTCCTLSLCVYIYVCVYIFSQVCLLTVVGQHAVSGQGNQAAAVPSLWGQGTVVKMCTPMHSCSPSSNLWKPMERWQKVGGFSIPVRKTPNLLSSEQMWPHFPFSAWFVVLLNCAVSFLFNTPEWNEMYGVDMWEIVGM